MNPIEFPIDTYIYTSWSFVVCQVGANNSNNYRVYDKKQMYLMGGYIQ